MSTGDPLGRPRVVRHPNLFGGTDVLSLYGRNGRIRTNRLHCASDAAATRVVQQSRQLERAELVEQDRVFKTDDSLDQGTRREPRLAPSF
jgi:hypothetical protein